MKARSLHPTTTQAEWMNAVLPLWEPVPWDAPDETAGTMYAGYNERVGKTIHWQALPLNDFPKDGLFGHGRRWFVDRDIAFFASNEDEDLLLVDNVWSGWPDPPRWGLASRPRGRSDARWRMWGHFPELPATWTLPESQAADAQD